MNAVKLLEDFREMGAIKLTLMGVNQLYMIIKNDQQKFISLNKKIKRIRI